MLNNDENIIVKQPKVSAFAFFFRIKKKGFFSPLKFVGSPLVWSCIHLQ